MPSNVSPQKIIAIGDVHGCAEELKLLLRMLPLDQNTTIVFLGDYVDRGPDAKGVIDAILDLSQIYRVIPLKGNHEWLFSQFLDNPNDALASSNFILNGGSNTLASYSSDGVTYKLPEAHRKFLESLPLFHATDSHYYVHAGIPPGFDFPAEPDRRTAHQMLWIRSVFLDSTEQWPKVIVHGHTPVDEPEILPNRINLDTGCVFGRRLTAMNMATGELYSVARDEKLEAKFLASDTPGGVKRALRFEGEIAVELLLGDKPFPFRTVNFNEFGLLIYPAAGSEQVVLTLAQSITGLIQPGGDLVFSFTAVVVRESVVGGAPAYGIKFEELHNLKDRA